MLKRNFAKLVLLMPILPARMTLNTDGLKSVHFATLDFPFTYALKNLQNGVKDAYNLYYGLKNDSMLPFDKLPPWRQLNTAIMAICPVLVHAFEKNGEVRTLVTIDRVVCDSNTGAVTSEPQQLPSEKDFADIIGTWVEQWLGDPELKTIAEQSVALRSQINSFKNALKNPETSWFKQRALTGLIYQLSSSGSLGFNSIPAVIIALLNGQTMTITSTTGKQEQITWRRAHNVGAKGLHLISQPMFLSLQKSGRTFGKTDKADESSPMAEGCIVYYLKVRVQTQAGRLDKKNDLIPLIFLDVGMRRFAHEPFLKDPVYKRRLSVLVAMNRDQLLPEDAKRLKPFPSDSTLVSLPVDVKNKVWDYNLARLLSAYGLTSLEDAAKVLIQPAKYGDLKNTQTHKGNEYYYPVKQELRDTGERA